MARGAGLGRRLDADGRVPKKPLAWAARLDNLLKRHTRAAVFDRERIMTEVHPRFTQGASKSFHFLSGSPVRLAFTRSDLHEIHRGVCFYLIVRETADSDPPCPPRQITRGRYRAILGIHAQARTAAAARRHCEEAFGAAARSHMVGSFPHGASPRQRIAT